MNKNDVHEAASLVAREMELKNLGDDARFFGDEGYGLEVISTRNLGLLGKRADELNAFCLRIAAHELGKVRERLFELGVTDEI